MLCHIPEHILFSTSVCKKQEELTTGAFPNRTVAASSSDSAFSFARTVHTTSYSGFPADLREDRGIKKSSSLAERFPKGYFVPHTLSCGLCNQSILYAKGITMKAIV